MIDCPVCASGDVEQKRAEALDLPPRIVVDARGFYWRDYTDEPLDLPNGRHPHYSMCPVSEDNEPLKPAAVYVPQGPTPEGLAADIDAVADALNGWDQGEEPRPDTHRHWSRIVDHLRAAQEAPAPEGLRGAWPDLDYALGAALGSTDHPLLLRLRALAAPPSPAEPPRPDLPEDACGVMGLCELPKRHEGAHQTSVDRVLGAEARPPEGLDTADDYCRKCGHKRGSHESRGCLSCRCRRFALRLSAGGAGRLGCWSGRSVGYGPARWTHRIADLSAAVFLAICGPLSRGLCRVTLTW